MLRVAIGVRPHSPNRRSAIALFKWDHLLLSFLAFVHPSWIEFSMMTAWPATPRTCGRITKYREYFILNYSLQSFDYFNRTSIEVSLLIVIDVASKRYRVSIRLMYSVRNFEWYQLIARVLRERMLELPRGSYAFQGRKVWNVQRVGTARKFLTSAVT